MIHLIELHYIYITPDLVAGSSKSRAFTVGKSRSHERSQHKQHPYQPVCSPTRSEQDTQNQEFVTWLLNSSTQGKMMNHVQSPCRESSEKQQEVGPEVRLETGLQHSSKFQLGNKGRDRATGMYTYNIAHTD